MQHSKPFMCVQKAAVGGGCKSAVAAEMHLSCWEMPPGLVHADPFLYVAGLPLCPYFYSVTYVRGCLPHQVQAGVRRI